MFLTRVTEFKDETQSKMACIRNSHLSHAAWHDFPCDLSQKAGPLETRKVGPFETQKVGPFETRKVGPHETRKVGPFETRKVGPL